MWIHYIREVYNIYIHNPVQTNLISKNDDKLNKTQK